MPQRLYTQPYISKPILMGLIIFMICLYVLHFTVMRSLILSMIIVGMMALYYFMWEVYLNSSSYF